MSRLDAILALPKITHNLVQGSPEWQGFRLQHRGASEAAAALGLSRKVKRTELLHMKHTQLPREFSDWLQKNVLDYGHEVEALARPHVEALIGDDLYPVTCSRGSLSASCDGLTMDDRIAFEHKQWNEDLAALVHTGNVPDEHMPQCQQILLVTGAEELYFVVSDGTPERMVYAVVHPERPWWERLVAGWDQFDADLSVYQPAAAAPKVVAEPVEALPAPMVQVSGQLTLQDNFRIFEERLRHFLEHRLIREPRTDEDFVNLDAQIKAMKQAEAALESAEAQMLAQIQTVDQAKKTKDMLAKLVRDNRLMAEKLLASEKERRRGEIVAGARAEFAAHLQHLNQRLGGGYMPDVPADFAGAIKGLKSLASMENAVGTTLANSKIAANEIADRIEANLRHLREHAAEYRALFPDAKVIVLKAPDDLQALVAARIAQHRAAEERRLEAERERIRAEEAARLEREAQARAAAEARQREEQEAADRRQRDEAEAAQRRQDQAAAQPATAPTAPPSTVVPMPTRAPAAPAPRILTLGAISQRLGFALSASFVCDTLGVAGERVKAATMFSEPEFDEICLRLARRVENVRLQHQQRAA